MIQWLVYKSSDFLCFWTNLRFWMNRVSQWFSDSFRNPVTCFVSEQIYVFEWIEWVSDSVTRSEIQWLPLFLNKSTFLNESSESVIQWLVQKSSDFLCFWTNLRFWMNRVSQWFSDSFRNPVTSFVSEQIYVFEWIEWVSDSVTRSEIQWLPLFLNKSTFLNESSESVIQWLVQKSSDFLCFWTNLRFWMNRVSQWFSDSFRNPVTSFVSEQIYVFEWIEWVSDSVTRSEIQWLPLFLNKSTFLNESSESVIQWLVQKSSDFLCFWTNLRFWMNQVSQWFSDSFINPVTFFVSEQIYVFEWIEWVNDSVTRSQRQSLASVLYESMFLNESSDSMIQWVIYKCSHFVSEQICFCMIWVNQWFNDTFIKRVTGFGSE